MQPGVVLRHKNRVFEQFDNWNAASVGMVFAMVVETVGSTYAKAGDFMLITEDGRYQGLLSGGCVEGDLALHAAALGQAGGARLIHYDLGGEHDEIWGMGAGCDGQLTILLQSFLNPAFISVFDQMVGHYRQGRNIQVGVSGAVPTLEWEVLERPTRGVTSHFQVQQDTVEGHLVVPRAPRLLVCGAGNDVWPLLDLTAVLGWPVTIADHRDHYLNALAERSQVQVAPGPAATLGERVNLATHDAAIVMSHHLASDQEYLSEIATVDHWLYIGLLGPPHRRERLMRAVPEAGRLSERIRGPAGLPIGGREPASIALSIVAEMHSAVAHAGALTG